MDGTRKVRLVARRSRKGAPAIFARALFVRASCQAPPRRLSKSASILLWSAGMAEGRMSLPVARRFGQTTRRDLWWVQPLVAFLGFSAFIVYSTWAAFQNDYYAYGPYLSPFYSPALVVDPPEIHHS